MCITVVGMVKLTKPHNAPLCFLLTHESGRSVLIQSDWDWPSVASNLGFVPCLRCDYTDGTVDCEHKTAGRMIGEAYDFLMDHLGDSFEDPGYFTEENENV